MFKLIPSTNNLYEVDREGNIRRIISYSNNQPPYKKQALIKIGGKILKHGNHTNGYKQVAIRAETGIQKTKYVHRLVAEAWIGQILKGMEVNHKDGDKTNNCVDNLEIVSKSENLKHAIRTGLRQPLILRGSKNARATTTEAEVLKIRKEHSVHHSRVKIKQNYPHLSKAAIAEIVSRRSWKHI